MEPSTPKASQSMVVIPLSSIKGTFSFCATQRIASGYSPCVFTDVYKRQGYPVQDESKKALAEQLFSEVIDYARANNKYWAQTGDEWQKVWISDNDNKYHIFEIQYIASKNYGNPVSYTHLSPGTIPLFAVRGTNRIRLICTGVPKSIPTEEVVT